MCTCGLMHYGQGQGQPRLVHDDFKPQGSPEFARLVEREQCKLQTGHVPSRYTSPTIHANRGSLVDRCFLRHQH